MKTLNKKYRETFGKTNHSLFPCLIAILQKNLNIKVGDEILFTYKSYKIKEKVLELIDVPDYVYYIKDDKAIFPTHEDQGSLHFYFYL